MTYKELRAAARAQLGGSLFDNVWMLALLVCAIAPAMMGIISWLGFLLIGALELGLAGIFLSLARGKRSVDIVELFDGFKNYGESFLLGFMMALFVFLWTLLFVVPGIIMAIAYSMCFYIKHDHPEYDWKRCLDESRRMMNGHKAEFFGLQLSFLGWIIVGALCCGVGTLWVMPYIECTNANYYEYLKRRQGGGGMGFQSDGCFGSTVGNNASGGYQSPFADAPDQNQTEAL